MTSWWARNPVLNAGVETILRDMLTAMQLAFPLAVATGNPQVGAMWRELLLAGRKTDVGRSHRAY